MRIRQIHGGEEDYGWLCSDSTVSGSDASECQFWKPQEGETCSCVRILLEGYLIGIWVPTVRTGCWTGLGPGLIQQVGFSRVPSIFFGLTPNPAQSQAQFGSCKSMHIETATSSTPGNDAIRVQATLVPGNDPVSFVCFLGGS